MTQVFGAKKMPCSQGSPGQVLAFCSLKSLATWETLRSSRERQSAERLGGSGGWVGFSNEKWVVYHYNHYG